MGALVSGMLASMMQEEAWKVLSDPGLALAPVTTMTACLGQPAGRWEHAVQSQIFPSILAEAKADQSAASQPAPDMWAARSGSQNCLDDLHLTTVLASPAQSPDLHDCELLTWLLLFASEVW